MARWKDRFDSHEIHSLLERLRGLINDLPHPMDMQDQVEVARIDKIIEQIETALSKVDPETLNFHVIDEMVRLLLDSPIIDRLVSYKNSGDGHLFREVNEALNDRVMFYLAELKAAARISARDKPLRSTERLAEQISQQLKIQLDQASETISNNVETIEKLKGQATWASIYTQERIQHLNDILTQFQNKSSEEQNKRNNEFTEDQNRRNNKFTEGQTKRQTAFQDDQSERATKYAEWMNQHQRDAEAGITKLTHEQSEQLEAKSNAILDAMQKTLGTAKQAHEEMLTLFEIAAGDSFSAGYTKTAKAEASSAKNWNIAAIIFIIMATLAGILAIWRADACNEECNNWLLLVQSIPVTAILLIGAVFSARRAKMHHDHEHAARWLALEVRAIEPFIASLSQKDKAALKAKLAEKLFGQQSHQSSKGVDKEIIKDSIFSIIGRECIDWFKKSKGGE